MNSERIDPAGAAPGSSDEGDDVADTRSPDAIQKEIEQTRAELADTIDAIADRISPKRAASRGAAAVKAQVSGVFGSNGHASAPASVLDAPAAAASKTDTQQRQQQVQQIAASGGGSAYTGSSQYAVKRSLRVDRVLVVVGVAAAMTGYLVLRRSRR